MKYCYNCNRITPGEPLFCSSCGRTYNHKICAHKHLNPRHAMVCSQCGSREFSTPQPKVPWWAPALEFALASVPGLILVAASVAAIAAIVDALSRNPEFLFSLAVPVGLLGILWWMWLQLPRWFREAIHKLLTSRRDGDDRRRH
jgi:hypothetical protein